MLDQFTNADRNLIYTKVSVELIVIVLVIYNFYNGVLVIPLGIMYLAFRLWQYNRKSVEDFLCL